MAALAVAVGCVLLSGCVANDTVCPAVMYRNAAELILTSPDDSAVDIQVCAAAGCASTREGYSVSDDFSTEVIASGDGRWTATFDGAPESIEVRLLDVEGSAILDTTVDVAWDRKPGYGDCPAPATVAPIELTLD